MPPTLSRFSFFSQAKLSQIKVAFLAMAFSAGLCSLSATAAVPTATVTLAITNTSSGAAVTTATPGTEITLTATVKASSTAIYPGQVYFCDASATYCTDIHIVAKAALTSAGTATYRFYPRCRCPPIQGLLPRHHYVRRPKLCQLRPHRHGQQHHGHQHHHRAERFGRELHPDVHHHRQPARVPHRHRFLCGHESQQRSHRVCRCPRLPLPHSPPLAPTARRSVRKPSASETLTAMAFRTS